MKKALSFIISLIICLSVFALSTPVAFAANYNGSCGEDAQWSLNTVSGVLTISGSGEMRDFSISSTPEWDRYQSYIKSVVFDDGISYIGAYTFYNGGNGNKYKKLASVDFGCVDTIGEYAFRGCSALSELSNCDYVYSIGNHAFRGCSSLESIPFSAAEYIGIGAFCYCSSIRTLTVPDNVDSIGAEAFSNCSSAETITLPSSITAIGERAFTDCGNVSLINYYSRLLSTVGSGIFDNTGAVSGLTLNIGSSVIAIPANLFENCSRLTTIQGGSNLTTLENNAFAHTGITSFTVNSRLRSISSTAFADCTSLASFTVSDANEYFSSDESGILFNYEGTEIVRYPCGKTDTSYTLPATISYISDGAFRESRYLTTFVSQATAAKIPSNCFTNCYSLSSVTLSSSQKTIDTYAFANCPQLSNISMSDVTQINTYAFTQCSSLASLTTPSSLRTIGDFAFALCSDLTTVRITSGVTSIGKYAFYNCLSLASVTLPATLKYIYEGAFSFCSSLRSITIPSNTETIDRFAFLSCTALTSATVPASVKTIGAQAFGFKYVSSSSVERIPGFVLRCPSGSAAYDYATSNSLTSEIITSGVDEFELEDTETVQEPVGDEPAPFSISSIPEMIDGLFESLIGSSIYGLLKQIIILIINNLFH